MLGNIAFLVFVLVLVLVIGALIYYRRSPVVRSVSQGDFDDAAHEIKILTDQYHAGCLTTLELIEGINRHREVVVAGTYAGFKDPNTGLASIRRVA